MEYKIDVRAFPVTRNGMPISSGMTLRDYFAAKAMQALLANLGPYEDDPHRLDRKEYYKRSDLAYDADTLAEYAYTQADAMMNARGEQ